MAERVTLEQPRIASVPMNTSRVISAADLGVVVSQEPAPVSPLDELQKLESSFAKAPQRKSSSTQSSSDSADDLKISSVSDGLRAYRRFVQRILQKLAEQSICSSGPRNLDVVHAPIVDAGVSIDGNFLCAQGTTANDAIDGVRKAFLVQTQSFVNNITAILSKAMNSANRLMERLALLTNQICDGVKKRQTQIKTQVGYLEYDVGDSGDARIRGGLEDIGTKYALTLQALSEDYDFPCLVMLSDQAHALVDALRSSETNSTSQVDPLLSNVKSALSCVRSSIPAAKRNLEIEPTIKEWRALFRGLAESKDVRTGAQVTLRANALERAEMVKRAGEITEAAEVEAANSNYKALLLRTAQMLGQELGTASKQAETLENQFARVVANTCQALSKLQARSLEQKPEDFSSVTDCLSTCDAGRSFVTEELANVSRKAVAKSKARVKLVFAVELPA